MQRYVFVFAAVLAAVASKGAYAMCPSVTGKFPFDEAKFAGEWNIVAYVPNPSYSMSDKKCAKLIITSFKDENGTTMNFKFNHISDGKTNTGEGISYSKGVGGATSYAVHKRYDAEKFSPVSKRSFIATDYDNYAVSIACRPSFNSETKEFGREMYANIYARGKTLCEDTLKTLKSLLTSYDIEYDSIKMMDHDC